LDNKAGVQLKRENAELRTERQRLYEICELACKFFEKQLQASAMGNQALEYLLKRGIAGESIKKWRLGYSPDMWNGLSDFLVSKGYQRAEIVRAGLAIEKENPSASLRAGKSDSYDRFRGRIIFPVFGLNSEVLGFGGRVFKSQNEKEIAKYINSPQTLLYDKSSILYGLHNAKLAIRKKNQCVVTEGYTDAIMCHQAGYENTVAASGTALTLQHLKLLKRYSDNLVLAFDMDVAGDSATKRGINLAQEQGFNIKIIEHYGEGDKKSDPAEIILKDAKLWEESLSGAKSIMDYYFDSAFLNFDAKSPEGKKEIGKIVLPAIKRLANKIEQSYWVQKLSGLLNVKEEAILEELAKTIAQERSTFATEQVKSDNNFNDQILGVEGRKKLIEEKVISLILKNPEYIKLISPLYYPLFSDKIKQFLEEIEKIVKAEKPAEEGQLKKDFEIIFNNETLNAELKNFLAALALQADAQYFEDGQDELSLCLLQLKNIELKDKLNKISEDIKKAEQASDHQKVTALIEKFNTLTKEL
jgi:DNA primase